MKMELKVRKPHDRYLKELVKRMRRFNKTVIINDERSAKALGRIGKKTGLFSIVRERNGKTFLLPKRRFKIERIDEFLDHTWFKIKT